MSNATIGVDQRFVVNLRSSGVSSLTSKLNCNNLKMNIQQEQNWFKFEKYDFHMHFGGANQYEFVVVKAQCLWQHRVASVCWLRVEKPLGWANIFQVFSTI